MPASFIVDGDNVTVRFDYTANLTKAQDAVDAASHFHYGDGMGDGQVPFDDLTWQQKIDLLHVKLRQQILNWARQYEVRVAQRAAQQAASEAANTEHDLGDD